MEQYIIHVQQIPDMQQDVQLFLNLLSPSLRSQILFHVYKTLVRKIPIFEQCSSIELRYIMNNMRTIIFLPGDDIIRQGDTGKKLYFISRGKVEVWIGPDDYQEKSDEHKSEGSESVSCSSRPATVMKLVRDMDEGEYFGEISLITNLKRTATVKAKDFTTLAFMMKRYFLQSKEEFP